DSDAKRDLAIIQAQSLPASAPALKLAAASPVPGDVVHSLGNPGVSDALWVYTSGTVRQIYVKKMLYANNQFIEARVIDTSSPINPGDSGGPVVNGQGELVGVTSGFGRGAALMTAAIDLSEIKAEVAVVPVLLAPRTAADFTRRGEHFALRGKMEPALADFAAA